MARFVQIPNFGLADGDNFILQGELIYQSDLWPDYIAVPKGFVSDFASVPRIFRPLHPVNGKHRAPAVVHDYLVRKEGFDRRVADRIFLEAMEATGVAKWRRYQMYWAVALVTFFKRFGK